MWDVVSLDVSMTPIYPWATVEEFLGCCVLLKGMLLVLLHHTVTQIGLSVSNKHCLCYLCQPCHQKCGLFFQLQMFIWRRLHATAPHTPQCKSCNAIRDNMSVFFARGSSLCAVTSVKQQQKLCYTTIMTHPSDTNKCNTLFLIPCRAMERHVYKTICVFFAKLLCGMIHVLIMILLGNIETTQDCQNWNDSANRFYEDKYNVD